MNCRLMVLGTALASIITCAISTAGFAESLQTCTSACYPNPTEDCFRLKENGSTQGVAAGFTWLFTQFGSAPIQIPKSELQLQFRVSDDECNRGNTFINLDNITNAGPNACTISTTVSVGSKTIGAGIVIPAQLFASWSRRADGVITLSLMGQPFESYPFLGFSNDYLQEAWGGLVSAVQFGQQSSLLVTTNGCIRYDY
ncbi:hypothetical protein ACCS67_00755 [Rhizobium brockwellii]|uniref:hypothetical protein n=1 Tax=Rhizobium brockwellii TaxID=3019932 RepID=UPI003F959225